MANFAALKHADVRLGHADDLREIRLPQALLEAQFTNASAGGFRCYVGPGGPADTGSLHLEGLYAAVPTDRPLVVPILGRAMRVPFRRLWPTGQVMTEAIDIIRLLTAALTLLRELLSRRH